MNPPAELTELTEINTMLPRLQGLPDAVKALQTDLTSVQDKLTDLRRSTLSRSHAPRPSTPGQVSDDCAAWLGATFVAHCQKSGRIEALADCAGAVIPWDDGVIAVAVWAWDAAAQARGLLEAKDFKCGEVFAKLLFPYGRQGCVSRYAV